MFTLLPNSVMELITDFWCCIFFVICAKIRDPTYFRTRCILSTTSPLTSKPTTPLHDIEKLLLPSLQAHSNSDAANRPWTSHTSSTTAVLDVEKLQLISLDAHSNSFATKRPWTYSRPVGPSMEADFGVTLATDTLLTSEEAVIAAAAAEAVALAKAAVKFAKDAVILVNQHNSTESDSIPTLLSSEANNFLFETAQLAQLGESAQVGVVGELNTAENQMGESYSLRYSLGGSDDAEPTYEELEIPPQKSKSVAVRSRRQMEQKARRARAAERAAANVVSVKSDSASQKKRSSLQEVDYSDPLRYFRGTTSTSKLLNTTEELELSAGIQDLLKLEKLQAQLAERCRVQPSFAQWAAAAGVDKKILRKRLNYGILCKEKMIKSNIRLVISIAKNYQGSGMDLQDLVQEGCRGLVRGVEKFDASKGFKFSTYAHWWIKQAVRKSLSEQSRTIRLPFHLVVATYRVKEARKKFYGENGRHPDNEEVAEATGLSIQRLNAVLQTPKPPRSLDQKIGFNENLKPSDVIADPEAETLEDLLMKQFMKQDLENLLDTLNPREKKVIRWRFGMEDGRMKTLQEIGELMGVSRERIRQIELCGFRKLKNKKRIKHLQSYLSSYSPES